MRVGDHIYVRSVRGPKGGWYRRLRANPDGEAWDGEHRHLVHAEAVTDAGTLDQVTRAYAIKYGAAHLCGRCLGGRRSTRPCVWTRPRAPPKCRDVRLMW